MPTAVVLGASAAGSVTALQLARSGWEVQLVDPELDVISSASDVVRRRAGAPQVVQAHAYLSRARLELVRRLPDVHDALLAAGAHEDAITTRLPPHLLDGGRDGDDDLTLYQSRRIVFDRAIWDAVVREPRIVTVHDKPTGLRYAGGQVDHVDGPPRVIGVTLREGPALDGDVVIDAAGRRSPVHGWLDLVGRAGPEEVWTCGVNYYGRHYRVGAGRRPTLNAGFATVTEYPSLDMLWFIGDNDTAMLAVGAHASDPLLKALRHEGALDAVARENPEVGSWLEMSEAMTEVFVMRAMASRLRRMTRGGEPVALGLFHVGDALATTNPTRGRGLGMAFAAGGVLVDLLVSDHSDLDAVARRYDTWIGESLTPYFREAADNDYRKGAQKRAAVDGGRVLPENAPSVLLPASCPVTSEDVERAARVDPDVLRALIRANLLLDDGRRIASADVVSRVREALSTVPAGDSAPTAADAPRHGLHDRRRIAELVAPWST